MNEYTDLLVEAGAASSALEGYDFDGTAAGSAAGLLNSLADAVDDLTARNDVTSVLEEKWRHTALAAMEERDALRAQLDKVREALNEYHKHTLPGVWLAMRLADVAEWVEVE